MIKFQIVVAHDDKFGIGKNNTLPWHNSADLKRFKEITTSPSYYPSAVIMGRKTWESLPLEWLPGRVNIVLSRGNNVPIQELNTFLPGTKGIMCRSLNLALAYLEDTEFPLPPKVGKCKLVSVIGGGQVYAEALEHPSCDSLEVTHIDGDYQCDTFMPVNSMYGRFMRTKCEVGPGLTWSTYKKVVL